ncbi:G-patch domain and KOW motifs-containing protein homolog 1 [Ceratitis capitata]|uniref:G-patch domain and KOW motifs-containing protein homolog 1 n=1 Tax=Ceratitis capitata TaxID=7213 RepID=UPI00032997FE|nr:G-patch domain and KOW motifs-containing protein homolog 1 [Ceratitis capitata]XP_020718126.1 G-patch domain and KOW motifs-containing protein homolog 1 [Ceratitis capitata]XP_020718127.1 G-patch domain and KOW motifs-containing protein homolog 1 [Ceratitis capitata]
METKKISFGFSKIAKKPNLLPSNKAKEKEDSKVELIKCLEGQKIKLMQEKQVAAPLVIPLKESTKTSAALASLIKRRAVLLGEADELPANEPLPNVNSTTKDIDNLPLEERAARELLASVQNNGNETIDQSLILPALKADELPLDGAKQSSIDDYESVPIEQFGKAILRGMGWIEPIQKNGQPTAEEMPFVRPKGMGLGADKALKKQPLLVAPEKNEILEIKKLAYVRVLGGKNKDLYGQIEGFDDHAGRVIVKMAIGGAKEAFNEFLCQPVSKKEYAQYGKCINTAKYEEYKRMENEQGQIIIKKEDKDRKSPKDEDKVKVEIKKEGETNKYDRSDRNKRENNEESRKNKCESYRQRSDYQSSSRKHDDRVNYSNNGDRVEDDRRNRRRNSGSRHYEEDEQRSSGSRREYYDERRNVRDQNKRRSRGRIIRLSQEERLPSASSSSRRQQYTDDTSASSGTDSDSDSAYERKMKKKSSHKSKAKKSSKKSKRKHNRTTETESSTDSDGEKEAILWQKKQHKKKTKKSKKPRSRSRSHERSSRR